MLANRPAYFFHAKKRINMNSTLRRDITLSYCDTTQPRHRGTVYQQSGFHLVRENDAGLQTYARAVRPLTWGEDAYVQYFADRSLRSRRYRSRRQSERAARQLAFQTDTASFEAPRLVPSL